ncbi:hypothetical protein TELCIR_17474, partial [Teladorsagia circumcincta]
EVPLPAIAAGMDFTNSWFMSEVLRRCGAFYIRRAIGQLVVPVTTNYDKLLEEMLYSYELLGFPKPKESTSGATAGVAKRKDIVRAETRGAVCCGPWGQIGQRWFAQKEMIELVELCMA